VADRSAGQAVAPFDGTTGTFRVAATDKRPPDFRARGRLQYADSRYLQFAGSGEYFLKLGTDSPETLLAYADFDGTVARKPQVPLHTYAPHVPDWGAGDPTWQGAKGKGLIGAINYLASKGVNSISFLPYNAGGDGDNIWPFVDRDDKSHYDVSKLDQWQVLFDYAQQKGIYLHFKLQEQEIDDNVRGNSTQPVRESLDGGDLGAERKLYVRELVARFGYLLALNWNIGEENTQSANSSSRWRYTSGYRSLRRTPHRRARVSRPAGSDLSGAARRPVALHRRIASDAVECGHDRTLRWVLASAQAGKPWVVANDEQGPSTLGVPPDPGYAGFSGGTRAGQGMPYGIDDIRKYSLWGNLMAGGASVEYFGYALPDNDRGGEFPQP
jgi:hypothetical protein